jgi:ABC-type sugar transport system ATPase subunit
MRCRLQRRERGLFFALGALSIPAVFVTHDHADAMMLADRIAVLRAGTIVQYGPAPEIFAKPANTFVARFSGINHRQDRDGRN